MKRKRIKERLLEQMRKMLVEKGCVPQVRDLAREARTSTSQFHNYFGTIEGILSEVLMTGSILIEREVLWKIALSPDRDFSALLGASFEGILEALDKEPEAVGAVIVLCSDGGGLWLDGTLKPEFLSFSQIFFRLWSPALIRQGVPDEEVSLYCNLAQGGLMNVVYKILPSIRKDGEVVDRSEQIRIFRKLAYSLAPPSLPPVVTL